MGGVISSFILDPSVEFIYLKPHRINKKAANEREYLLSWLLIYLTKFAANRGYSKH